MGLWAFYIYAHASDDILYRVKLAGGAGIGLTSVMLYHLQRLGVKNLERKKKKLGIGFTSVLVSQQKP